MITSFNKSNARQIGFEIERALKEIGDRYGVDIRYAGGKFDAATFDAKVKCTVRDTNTAVNVERGKWNVNCWAVGLQPSDFGLEFSCPQGRYRITGIATNRRKYPIRARDLVNNKDILLSEGYVSWIKAARPQQPA